jgi:hypothetical protein
VYVPSGRTILGVGLQRPVCWDYGFEFRRGHGCLSFESVVCCQVDVFATRCLLVQRTPTEFGVSQCDRAVSTTRRPWLTGSCRAMGKKDKMFIVNLSYQ